MQNIIKKVFFTGVEFSFILLALVETPSAASFSITALTTLTLSKHEVKYLHPSGGIVALEKEVMYKIRTRYISVKCRFSNILMQHL